jgi:imidazoleglycerol-phosphate dehydratase
MTNLARYGEISRHTLETQIDLKLWLDDPGHHRIDTNQAFLSHMLDQLQRHGRLGIDLQAVGDVAVDAHHLAEDVGIALGMAVHQALGDKTGIERYADAYVPMDETLAHVVLDFSGRAHLAFVPEELAVVGTAGGFSIYHLRELLRGFVNHAAVTLHVRLLAGREVHHVVEAIMKAFARALYIATRRTSGELMSTKGML